MTRTAVITPVAGRERHLRNQQLGLAAGLLVPDIRVLVAMGDRPVAAGSRDVVVRVGAEANGWPLARARNEGARAAIEHGAELLVFLDVDCIPSARLLSRYLAATHVVDALLCGPVHYLDPPGPNGYDGRLPSAPIGHPARPVPAENEIRTDGDPRLFWSLSFALTTPNWLRIGGFHEDYEGYGAEDTDFGQLAARQQIGLAWVGGAWAFHQFHPTVDPPVQHLADIVRNATIFHRRWGWWPMLGWLTEFERQGLVALDQSTSTWTILEPISG
jgi:GT2 family glycosyltransferase